MRIAIVMVTIDRSETGRKNYFGSTIKSLVDSGLHVSNTPFEFHVFDGGSKSQDVMYCRTPTMMHMSDVRLAPNVNVGRALLFGSQLHVDWVLFLEDDVEVCKNFLDGVAYWLSHYAGIGYRLFTMYTPYREIAEAFQSKKQVWNYPVEKFYGTQCFAVRPREAQSIGEYLVSLPYPTSSYDIEIQNWAKANPIQKEPENFLASVPCFVQHIGEQSVLFSDPARFHQTSGWLGKNWRAYSE